MDDYKWMWVGKKGVDVNWRVRVIDSVGFGWGWLILKTKYRFQWLYILRVYYFTGHEEETASQEAGGG